MAGERGAHDSERGPRRGRLAEPVGLAHVRAGERVKRRTLAALLAIALAVAGKASAHQEPYSHIEIRVEPARMEGRVMGHVVDLAHEAGLPAPDSLFDPRYVAAHLARLHAVLDSHLLLFADGRRVTQRWGSF